MDHHRDPVRCPRCASSGIGGTGARGVCRSCGKEWQLGAPIAEPVMTAAEAFAGRRRIQTLPLRPAW